MPAMVLAGAGADVPRVEATVAPVAGSASMMSFRNERRAQAALNDRFSLEGVTPFLADREQRLGRGFAFGYALDGRKTLLTVRAGYRFGLPLDDALAPGDDSLVLRSGGTLRVSAGTVAWLQLDFEGFRELAGARVWRFDAVPGIRVRPFKESPVEAGVGCVASYARAGDKSGGRLATTVQLAGTF